MSEVLQQPIFAYRNPGHSSGGWNVGPFYKKTALQFAIEIQYITDGIFFGATLDGSTFTQCDFNFGDGSPTVSALPIVSTYDPIQGGSNPAYESQAVTHSYEHAGIYTFTVTIADSAGRTVSHTFPVGVLNHPPVASFTQNNRWNQFWFDGSDSSDADGDVLNYAWFVWPNGESVPADPIATTKTIPQYFLSPGVNWNIKLVVTDEDDAAGTETMQIRNIYSEGCAHDERGVIFSAIQCGPSMDDCRNTHITWWNVIGLNTRGTIENAVTPSLCRMPLDNRINLMAADPTDQTTKLYYSEDDGMTWQTYSDTPVWDGTYQNAAICSLWGGAFLSVAMLTDAEMNTTLWSKFSADGITWKTAVSLGPIDWNPNAGIFQVFQLHPSLSSDVVVTNGGITSYISYDFGQTWTAGPLSGAWDNTYSNASVISTVEGGYLATAVKIGAIPGGGSEPRVWSRYSKDGAAWGAPVNAIPYVTPDSVDDEIGGFDTCPIPLQLWANQKYELQIICSGPSPSYDYGRSWFNTQLGGIN